MAGWPWAPEISISLFSLRSRHPDFWASTTRAGSGGQSLRGYEVSAPSGYVGRSSGHPIAAVESRMEQTLPHHCGGGVARRPGQRWKSKEAVQKELQVGKLEDELACMGLLYVARAARLAPPYVVAMLQSGTATCRSAVLEDMECMYRPLAPKLDELGPPSETPTGWEEFTKRWPGQWQLMVTRFAEKWMEMGDGDERGGRSVSSGGAETVFRRSED